MSTATTVPDGDLGEGGRRTRWLLIGTGVGAAAVIGGGVAAAMMLSGGGDQPDSVLPGDAAVYVEMDLDPSLGEKVAAVRFFQGLDPDLRDRLSSGEWREWAWEQLEERGEAPEGVSYEEDIEPWLGDRVGMTVTPTGADEEPLVAVALQVEDGDAALAFLDEHLADEEDTAYYLAGDYVVLTAADSRTAVEAAVAGGSLAGSDTYSADMEDLGESGVMSMWADVSRLGEISGDYADLGDELGVDGLDDATGAGAMPELTGRLASTVRLTEDAIEVHGIARGLEGVPTSSGEGSTLVTGLPADTALALGLVGGGEAVQNAWSSYADAYGEELDSMVAEAESAGFTLPDDLATVLGDSMAVSVGPDIVQAIGGMSQTDPSLPALPVGYRVTTDTEQLQEVLNAAGIGQGVLVQRTDDGTLTLGTDQLYVDELAEGPESTLGSDELFTRAVPDAEDAQAILYVDVAPFEEFYLPQVNDPDARTALETLGAVGVSSTTEGEGDLRFTMRVVADAQD